MSARKLSAGRSRSRTSRQPDQDTLPTSPLAQQSIARDLEDENEGLDVENVLEATPSGGAGGTTGGDYSMIGSFRRMSSVAYGPRPLFASAYAPDSPQYASEQDREQALVEERSLLRDNQLIPRKHPRRDSEASNRSGNILGRKLSVPGFVPRKSYTGEAESAVLEQDDDADPTETTPLVRNKSLPYGGEDDPETIDRKWAEAVASGKIQTTWQREAKVLARYSWPLVVTFVLQYSLTVVSIFTVGHIGKIELGAVSLGSMSASITGYSVYFGLATSLDTLCAQAYGSGKKQLVGLQLQRMVYFLWLITIPIAIIWAAGPQILQLITPEKEIAAMAGRYLRVLIAGAPGYAAFEAGKRYVQAQGLFRATLYVLLFVSPLNVFLHWLFVWHFQWGYIGAPIALVIVENLLPICLVLYVRFVDGMECWSGFSMKAFQNWGPMVKLALPGLVMVLAEFLAFEILTLTSSYISATHLATQSILATISTLTYQIPFPISVAASTRIANLIGATLTDAGKTAAKVALVAAVGVGLVNCILLVSLRNYLPWLFTNDADVAELTARTLPLNAAFQLFDALAALANGILRGLGRQEIGGYTSIFAYYVVRNSCLTVDENPANMDIRLPCLYHLLRALACIGICMAYGR